MGSQTVPGNQHVAANLPQQLLKEEGSFQQLSPATIDRFFQSKC